MIRNEKPGLIMILASLLVMALTVYVLFDYQKDARDQQAREQGLGLARLISNMSWNQIINAPGKKGLLEVYSQGQNNPDFSYGQIIDLDGRVNSEVTSRGIIVPNDAISIEPQNWLGQRIVGGGNSQPFFIESHAPVFLDGIHKGFVKIGYTKPELSLGYKQMPFIATLTLPIFLLMPLFYFFLRQELKPLRKISQSIEKVTAQQLDQKIELQPNPELGQFMDRFNQFIDSTQARIKQLDREHDDLFTSGKLLTYKNSRIESILQTMPEAILVLDKAGDISYANQKIHSLLGVTPESILNKKPRDWCQSAELINILSGNNHKGSATTLSGSALSGGKANKDKNFEIKTYPLFSPNEEAKLLGRLVVIRDTTEQHFAQQRQGEFISQIAHELKTPLNVLAMYSESLLDEGMSSDEHRIEAANVIHDEVERLGNLIQNLLSISQYELGGLVIERQRVRIKDFLEDVFNNIAKSDRVKQLTFEIDLPHDMSAIYIDKALMRIALNNLLTNAVKYNKQNGTVTLEAKETEDSIEINVSDEGYGISEQDQLHIFDKFFRSEDNNIRQQTGHGLGLSLTHQIVQIHQGELNVNSTLGQGSLFQIRLDKDVESMSGS